MAVPDKKEAIMADESYVAVAAQYASEDAAVADFDEIGAHYKEDDKHEHGPLDAAVITRGLDGKLAIVKRDDGEAEDGEHSDGEVDQAGEGDHGTAERPQDQKDDGSGGETEEEN